MKTLLQSLYRRLPLARELIAIKESVNQIENTVKRLPETPRNPRLLETIAMVQAIEALKWGNPRFQDHRRLLFHGAQYWSQNYEDGMITEILRRIEPVSKTFVEIGVEDGSETNTTALLAQGWRGWWFEGNSKSCDAIRSRLKAMPVLASRLSLKNSFVSPENIQQLFREQGVPNEVDVFSLDIDLNTYHIWAALSEFRPRVIVVEYNAGFPPGQNWIHPYEPDKVWDCTQAFGASLKAYELLGKKYGYSLVGCDLTGINAFFVRNDLVEDKFAAPFTAENHYEPPRYYLWYRWGHPSCFFGENAVIDETIEAF